MLHPTQHRADLRPALSNMSSEPEDNVDPDEPDDFDAVLKAVARPPDVGHALLAKITLPSTLDMPDLPLAMGEPSQPEPTIGAVLDERYRLEQIVGRGGMGVVYGARNVRTGKVVAIKWMAVGRRNTPAQSITMAERFRREARAAASIRHPNVVDVYDVGGPDNAPFLVMELLEGEALSARIAQGTLPFDEAARVMLGVMRGVSAAHRAGIVHRDLKPDNVFLCSQPDGAASIPKVLDFGVAAIRDDSADGLVSLTRSGAIIGTPAYMSPEQLTGKPIDVRTDVYALGVMLFEALTGRLPFDARNAGELAVMQATGMPTRLSTMRPELFGACERLVARALAREAGDRFANVDEFARALEAVVSAPTSSPSSEKKRSGRRWLATVGLGLLLCVGLYVATRERAPQPVPKSRPDATRAVQSSDPPSQTVPSPQVVVAPPPAEEVRPAPSESKRGPNPTPGTQTPRARRPALGPRPSEPSTSTNNDKTNLRYEDF